ncbi:S8 family peptidase [Nisaea sp.]|uniref:S8 family peptidase n=1 Tax=Nisaea sp. TaxID=2024842 RepID=UPI003B520774
MTHIARIGRKFELLGLATAALSLVALSGPAWGNSILPSQETQSALERLSTQQSEKTSLEIYEKQDLKSFKVPPDKLDDPWSVKGSETASTNATEDVPIAVPNSMLLMLEPNTTSSEIQALLKKFNASVVKTFPSLGSVLVETDLSHYFATRLGDNHANDALLRGLTSSAEAFAADPRVKSATPDLLLRDKRVTNLLTPADVVLANPGATSEIVDWGMGDVEADRIWSMPGALDGAVIGVMDAGFNRHEDLVFMGIPRATPINDHGNHVAGIACARHNNSKGIKGVVPNCFIRPRSGEFFVDDATGGNVVRFLVRFSEILRSLLQFVESQDDVKVFNLSLGYNWGPNFGINPDAPDSGTWRGLVTQQGVFMLSILELATANNKVIYSAAGNDSSGLSDPIDARFASPFNWAAIEARKTGRSFNGVIVEAHDRTGNRAGFSNEKGHISCPGVDVFSTVAKDENNQVSDIAYGTMSGTSMASPYCAGGHILFSLVRPGYSGAEIVNCLESSTAKSDSDTPMLRLEEAVSRCPPK